MYLLATDPCPDSVAAEEWDYLDIDVLKPARSSKVCMTCQHFRYEVGRHCVTLLTCPIHQGLIPQGEHLPTDHPLKLTFVRRFGLTHKLLRRKDLLD